MQVLDVKKFMSVKFELCLDATDSASRGEKSAGQSKAKKSKDGKESRSSKNQSGSRPASQQQNFDFTKPHWTLRMVTDANFAVSIVLCLNEFGFNRMNYSTAEK